ncbi:MAG TPA: HEAT repeat domain-containing protein [Pirellulales bacterium]|nr:HEAT repeat domain-containing protein [Pirellulales bacterium]
MDELVKKAPKMSPAEHEKESLALAKAIQREEDPLIRLQIVRTLAVFPTKVAGDVLTAAAKDTDSDVRIACCHSWGTRKGPDAVKVLGGLLNSDTDLDVRIAAARALGETRDTSAIESLGQALEDKDPAMQHRAIVSLEKITGKHLGTDAEAWRAFVRGDNPPEESLASRVKRWF